MTENKREIKFRAWDCHEKRFAPDEPRVAVGMDGRTYCVVVPYESWEEVGRYAIMQYTGLKDKNGKEIYEGDVVRCFGEWGQEYHWPVAYTKDGYWSPLVNVEEGYNAIDDYNPVGFEVIGNIYEQPELLENPELLEAK